MLARPGDGAAGEPSVEGQVESSCYLGTATQMVVAPATGPVTVLVPNADEAERQRLPAAGRSAARLVHEHMHW